MANTKLPDPLSRRHLLEGGLDPQKALALAESYLEAGREVEAVDFLIAAGTESNTQARDAVVKLQTAALERGDVFLMRVASAAIADEPTAQTWRELAATASAAGRSRDAESAERFATVGG